MPQEHLTTVLTTLFAPAEAVTPQTNAIIVYGAVFVLLGAVALALWAARPFRRGLGQKLLTPRPDDGDGLPWMPGGDIFETDADVAQPTPTPASTAPSYQPPPTYQAPPSYQPAPGYQPAPAYQPEPAYRPLAGAPQFGNAPPPSAPPQTPPGAPRNPWSTS